MQRNRLAFRVAHLSASAPAGVPVTWQGRALSSGPLCIELASDATDSHGVLDYEHERVTVDFHVQLRFPELAEELEALGVDPRLVQPLRAKIRSEGAIDPDHRLRLSGRCTLGDHELFPQAECAASVLPGH